MLMNDAAPLAKQAQVHAARLAPSTIALIVLAMLAPLALFFPTAASIVAIWNSSETFAHGYVIVPISLWLIWRKRENFQLYPPEPYWPALALLALCGAGWLAARLGGVQFVMQYAFAAMFPAMALAVMGRRLAMSLAFPLLFLLFAVPFGDIFIGPLIEFTADFTVWALQVTGIPVLRNGTRFEIPTGSWSVVTACSGVRYLISSVTIGCLYAYLSYRSLPRRLLFVALSIVVPIIANGLRAYMIVMIGHTSNMELATGVDHLVYGWVWFGLVMFIMFWVGSYWRDDHLAPPASSASGAVGAPAASIKGVAALAVAVCALWPAFALYNDKANENPAPVALNKPAVGWSAAPAFNGWKPFFMAPDAHLAAHYAQPASGRPLALNVFYYRNQSNKKALISSVNAMAEEGDAFHQVGSGARTEQLAGRPLAVREARMSGPGGTFLVWYWYWIDGSHTASDMKGKLIQAKAALLFHGDDGAAVMVAAPYGESPDEARAVLRDFLQTEGDAVERALTAARGK